MALPIPPPLGYPIPNTRHAVSVQMPTWQDMCGMALGEPRVKNIQQIGYPRSFLHHSVKKVGTSCQLCLLYPALAHAAACKTFLCSPQKGENDLNTDEIKVKAVDFKIKQSSSSHRDDENVPVVRLYTILFPANLMPRSMIFWRLTGTGISSRLADNLLEHVEHLREVPPTGREFSDKSIESAGMIAMDIICQRIVDLLERSPVGPLRLTPVSKSDVFLYPTGMSAIYHCHQLLLSWRGTQSIIFGFPYELTLKMLQTYGPECKFYGFGTSRELDHLEEYLQSEMENGRFVQAIWCECSSNPLLRTVDLNRIRGLADKYEFILVVDETIGSFANVDVLGVADIVITSLTKSFSGFLDVMAGSIVLNPLLPFYATLKCSLSAVYCNELYSADAIRLEHNSRDFLPRVSKLNTTAYTLVSLLYPYVSNSDSTITNVYYPSTCWSIANYRERMRPATPEFTPGYGGLFIIEFESVSAARAFFDTLEVHKGPSLGAHLTLAQPYVQTVFFREKEWAASYGLKETIVRISVGLEDESALVQTFERAVKKADEMK